MSRVSELLAKELGISLVGGETPDVLAGSPADFAALRGVGPDKIALALGRGAEAGGELAIECISVLVAALQMVGEADLDDDDWLLSVIGDKVRIVDAGRWIETLLAAAEAGDGAALDVLTQLVERWDMSKGIGETMGRAMPRVLALLDGPLGGHAAGVLREVLHHDKPASASTAVPRLIELLADESARDVAADALCELRDVRAVAPLIALLEDPTVSGQTKAYHAAAALRELRATAAVPALLVLLDEKPDRYLRDSYIHALAELDPLTAAPFVAQAVNPADASYHSIRVLYVGAQAGDPGSLAMLDQIASSSSLHRSQALTALGRVGGAGAFERLCAAATDADELTRAAAVAQLRELRTSRAFDALVGALRMNQPNAARALFELGDLRAVKPLTDALEVHLSYYQYDVLLKEAVIEALGDLAHDDERVWTRLVGCLTHRSDHVAECAAIALQQLRPGCRSGVTQLVRKISRLPNVPKLLDRNTLPMVTRLAEVARRGKLPYDNQAAATILTALRDLQPATASDPSVHAAVTELIEVWDAWLASARS